MLAHKAEMEGTHLVESLFGKNHKTIDYNTIPSVVYTNPEVAWVGQTEEQLRASSQKYRIGKFSLRANGRSLCNFDVDGFVKILASEEDGSLLGAHLVCSNAGDMIYGLASIIQYGGSAEDLHSVCFPHPTVSEAIKEALYIADPMRGKPIHS
ncbi:MAG: hypothetical protein MHPSP_002654 [Paramarteilia canceri]